MSLPSAVLQRRGAEMGGRPPTSDGEQGGAATGAAARLAVPPAGRCQVLMAPRAAVSGYSRPLVLSRSILCPFFLLRGKGNTRGPGRAVFSSQNTRPWGASCLSLIRLWLVSLLVATWEVRAVCPPGRSVSGSSGPRGPRGPPLVLSCSILCHFLLLQGKGNARGPGRAVSPFRIPAPGRPLSQSGGKQVSTA